MALPERREGRLVDVGTGILRRDHVLVQDTPAAILVLGYGQRAEALRRFACDEASGETDPFLSRCRGVARAAESGRLAKTRQTTLPRLILKMKDRIFRRLAIAEELAKDGFNPNQARDDSGRWTDEGGDTSETTAPALIEGRSVAAGSVTVNAAAAADFADSMASRPAWPFASELPATTRLGLGPVLN